MALSRGEAVLGADHEGTAIAGALDVHLAANVFSDDAAKRDTPTVDADGELLRWQDRQAIPVRHPRDVFVRDDVSPSAASRMRSRREHATGAARAAVEHYEALTSGSDIAPGTGGSASVRRWPQWQQ